MNTTEWLETWYELYVSPTKLAPSTQAMYRRSINAVPQWLGAIPLEMLTPVDVQRWLVTVAKATPRAAQLDRVMIMRAIKVAHKSGLCSCLLDEDTLPHVTHTAKQAITLTAEQAHAYLTGIKDKRCYVLLLLCLVCGLRRGEALGLRWQDVDTANGCITINRQRQRINGKYHSRPLKSRSAHRVLALPPEVMRIIQQQPRTVSGWIIDATPEQLRNDHLAAIRALHLPPVTIHGLRHTMAMLAIGAGAQLKLLQVAMGHATIKLTADLYTNHSFPPISTPSLVWQGLAVV